jgi:uncharacterized membrane protein YdbT with pleckstrin-like domain
MSYVEKNLIPGESAFYRTGLHWIALVWPIVLALLFGVPGLAILVISAVVRQNYPGPVRIEGLVFLGIIVTAALVGFLRRSATEMAVTNKRVVVKTGVLTRRTYEILLSKVESIHVEEGLLGRMLGYGGAVVRGTGGTPEPFYRIAHPLELRRQVHHQIDVHEESSRATLPPHRSQ